MPLAAFACGLGPVGHDPVADPSDAAAVQELAPLIHPATKDAVPLSTGALQGVHPVDQAVSLALGIRRGTLGSVPTQGSPLADLEWGGRGMDAQVRLAVQEALAVLISRKDVDLLSVTTEPAGSGFTVSVSYRNRRLPADPSASSVPTTLLVAVT